MIFLIFVLLEIIRGYQNENNNYQIKFEEERHTMQLYGDSDLGYYYVNLYVGTPPQRQTVITDTGSSLTTFACQKCSNNCGKHLDPPFNPDASKTANPLYCNKDFYCSCNIENQCSFRTGYTEGSQLSGLFYSDYVILSDEIYNQQNVDDYRVNFTFGCTMRETNLFFTQQADGILGLGVQTNQSTNLPNIIDFTYQQHHHSNEIKAFSLCYGHHGGYMTIGGYNSERHLNYSTLLINYDDRQGQYNVQIHACRIGNLATSLTNQDFNLQQGTFFDSGTTIMYAHNTVYRAIIETVDRFCRQPGKCKGYKMSEKCWKKNLQSSYEEFYESFPPIVMELDYGQFYDWQPREYLLNENQQFCISVDPIQSRVILGTTFMRHMDILFDRQNKQIHITRSNCSEIVENLSPKNTYYSYGNQENIIKQKIALDHEKISKQNYSDENNISNQDSLIKIIHQLAIIGLIISGFLLLWSIFQRFWKMFKRLMTQTSVQQDHQISNINEFNETQDQLELISKIDIKQNQNNDESLFIEK